MEKLRAIEDKIIVRRLSEEQVSKGGIIVVEPGQKPTRGVVLAVGPGKVTDRGERIPMEVEKGDIVLFGQYAGNTMGMVTLDKDVICLRQGDILAVAE